jgi:hypothetical protein
MHGLSELRGTARRLCQERVISGPPMIVTATVTVARRRDEPAHDHAAPSAGPRLAPSPSGVSTSEVAHADFFCRYPRTSTQIRAHPITC